MIDFPSNPTNGQVYANYIYDSSITAWRNVNTDTGIGTLNAMGLKNVVPTSINVGSGSGTVNANGTVTFSAASSIQLNNIFTSTYTNYLITYSIKGSATSDIRHQLVSAGTVNTTAAYNNAGPAWITNALSSFNNSAGNNWMLSVSTSNTNNMTAAEVKLFNPALAARTLVISSSSGHDGTNAKHFWTNGVHTVESAYDGFYIFPVSGNITGTLNIYGLTN